jgi:DNA-binding response OmpR family regulator
VKEEAVPPPSRSWGSRDANALPGAPEADTILLDAWAGQVRLQSRQRDREFGIPVQQRATQLKVPAVAEKILLVEDEVALVETLQYNLLREGYQVTTATDGITALQVARAQRPDLILLDIMLPRLDGLEVCRILRKETNVPIIMLTARSDEVDRVVGLEMGADDYVSKPFSMRELLARVKALLRRVRLAQEEISDATRQPAAETIVSGDLTINLARHEVLLKGEPLPLSPKEYDLLLFLARNQGMTLTRDLILERVWGWDFDGGTRTVDVHVRGLREKIEDDPSNPRRIVTVRGVG